MRFFRTPDSLGQAEVQHFRPALGCDLDVGGFQVAMDDSLGVSRFQCVGNLSCAIESLIDGEGAAERFAFDQLQHQTCRTFGFLQTVNRGDVGMIQRGHGAGFLLEALATGRIVSQRLGQNLQGDFAFEPRVLCPIDLAHPPGAKRCENLCGPSLSPTDSGM